MDIIVVPSIREPFGNVIVEAGFCKKAVISGINGLLINPDKELSVDETVEDALPYPDVVVNPITNELQTLEIDPIKLRDSITKLALDYQTRKLYGEKSI